MNEVMNIHESMDEVLALTSDKFSERFYPVFFRIYPEAEKMFQDKNLSHQGAMLTMALQVVAYHYRRPTPASEDYLRILGFRHNVLGVGKIHYQKFAEALLTSLKEFHGEGWAPELEKEWSEALEQAANLMLRGEGTI